MNMKEEKISSEDIYDGKILHVKKDKVLCPNGNVSYREYIVHPGASAVLAKHGNKFLMVKQYRYPLDEVIYELPAGKLEDGEDPKLCALRELEEETGYKASNIEYLGKMYSSCGFTNEIIYMYFASDLIKTETNFDEDELIEIEEYSWEELIEKLKDNTIRDSKTIAAISLYNIKK